MNSGLMAAHGRASIERGGGKLDGLIEVEMRGSVNVVRVPVALGGTLGRPQLLRR
jgi:hypothetical protein